MEAIILVGGKGTRLQSVISDVPKPMAPINGKPFLSYILDHLVTQNITRVVLAVGYKKEVIQEHYQYQYDNLELLYSAEEMPLGTGGAIIKALEQCNSKNIFILNGDSYFPIDFSKMYEQHIATKADLTLAVKPMENFDRYGVVNSEKGRIVSFSEKKPMIKGNINAGTYLVNKAMLQSLLFPQIFSFEKAFLEKFTAEKCFIEYIADAYFIDIGIPEDYDLFLKEKE